MNIIIIFGDMTYSYETEIKIEVSIYTICIILVRILG